MKQFIITALVAAFACTGNLYANILTVNNTGTSPGQYASLPAAITAAAAGDTLLISGSNADYASGGYIYLNKPLKIFGTGFNPIKDNPLRSTVSGIILQSGAAGSVFEGLIISNSVGMDNYVPCNNITFKRNYLNYVTGIGDNWLIQENLFSFNNGVLSLNGNNDVVKNNVFQNTPYFNVSNTPANTNFVFSNNIVFDGEFTSSTLYNAVVANNIFYDSSKSNFAYFSGNTANTTFTNNIVYGNPVANPFNIGSNGNSESGNKYGVDPQFTSLKILQSGYNLFESLQLISDLTLKPTSPGHGAGTDTKDIGIYGGVGSLNPLSGYPPIPQISTMNIQNTVIAPGATLNVQIKAKSSN